MKCMDSIKEAIGRGDLQEQRRAAEGWTLWNHSFTGSPGVKADPTALTSFISNSAVISECLFWREYPLSDFVELVLSSF